MVTTFAESVASKCQQNLANLWEGRLEDWKKKYSAGWWSGGFNAGDCRKTIALPIRSVDRWVSLHAISNEKCSPSGTVNAIGTELNLSALPNLQKLASMFRDSEIAPTEPARTITLTLIRRI